MHLPLLSDNREPLGYVCQPLRPLTSAFVVCELGYHLLLPIPPWCRQDAEFSFGHPQPTGIEASIFTHLQKLVNVALFRPRITIAEGDKR